MTGGTLTKTQTVAPEGIDLVFSSPVEADAGIYECIDGDSSDAARLNITDGNGVIVDVLAQ